MARLSGSRYISHLGPVCLAVIAVLCLDIVLAQDPFSDVLSPNTKLWKSFQEEMKTLEQAAHRVNKLITNANPPRAKEDQVAKASEKNPVAVTVLVSPDMLKNGIHTKPEESKVEEHENKKEEDSSSDLPIMSGVKQPNTLNLSSFMNAIGFFKTFPEPWWKGENVCVEKAVTEGRPKKGEKPKDKDGIIMGTGTFEHCKQTAGKYICKTVVTTPHLTKTFSTSYKCCEGYLRQANKCIPVDLDTAVDMLYMLNCISFAVLLNKHDVMRTEKNFTLFVPIEEAMKHRQVAYQESNRIRQERRARAVEEFNDIASATKDQQQSRLSGQDLLQAHMTDSLLDVEDFTNEMVVKSMFNDSPLRINIYPGREKAVITVNCARFVSADNTAIHSRIHTIDRVLEPVTQSVADILSQPQFSQFRHYLEQEGLMEKITNATAVTVFAPNNEAWDKLGDGLKDKYARGEVCIDRVLRHHILPLTLCTAPTTEGRLTTADINGELVQLSRDENNQLIIDDKGRVIQDDIIATNGVVHVLDKVLNPKSAKPLSELLLLSNHTTWLALLDKAGLMEELNKQENITVFVPTEQVLTEENTHNLLENMDRDTLRRVLLYHVTQKAPTCELRNHPELQTQAGATLRVSMFNPYLLFSGFEPQIAVQCAPLAHTDGKACHVVAHEVTRLLLPPNSTVLQLVSDNPQLSLLKRVMEGTEVEKEIEEKSELFINGFTLLAPTDEAFNKLDEDMLSRLLTDKKFANDVVRMHILKEPVCCASITSVPWPFTNSVRTLDDKKIEVNRDRKNRVLFSNSATEKCDVIATDGVIHIINNVLIPEVSKVKLGNIAFGTPDKRIMLFGI